MKGLIGLEDLFHEELDPLELDRRCLPESEIFEEE